MTLEMLHGVLIWSALINYGLLLVWFLTFRLARDWLHDFHGRWFRLSEEQFDAIHYAGMALYKLGILLFNLVPYIALRVVG
ncbi:hypothetical protein HP532_04320 [Pseudomonas sp. CrR25]|nr:hypothetical protein [Pseudomonas sp. CrR25]